MSGFKQVKTTSVYTTVWKTQGFKTTKIFRYTVAPVWADFCVLSKTEIAGILHFDGFVENKTAPPSPVGASSCQSPVCSMAEGGEPVKKDQLCVWYA